MQPPPIPADDQARIEALLALEILDTEPERDFDAIVRLAAELCQAPIALVSLVDGQRQWFKARVGLDAAQTPRDVSYCGHAILEDRTMVVPDAAKDPRFADNPLRTGPPHAEFYAGVPLRMSSGHKVGTLCVIDHKPRELTATQQAWLEALAAHVVRLLDLRRTALLQRDLLQSLRESNVSVRPGPESSDAIEQARTWSRGALLVACVLGVASVLSSLWVRHTVQAAGAVRLQHAAERADTFLEERVHAYEQILRGAGALFRASDHVSPRELRQYADALVLARNFPGLLGLGFAERVPRDRLDAWLSEARAENPELQLKSSGTGPELAINRMIEPIELNRPALGFNAASDSVRAAAMAAAREHRDVAATGRVRLLQDTARGPGFLIYLPVPGEAESAPRGWVFGALRARDLVDGLGAAVGADVVLRLIDEPGHAPLVGPAKLTGDIASSDVRFADRVFRLEVQPGRSFYAWSERTEPWAILVLGFAATLLAFALTTSMRRTEARSRALAIRMTDALRRREHDLQAANEALERLATTDALTGLFNRRVFDERLAEEMSRARRNGTPLSLVMVDVDCFKLYNDTYGHQQGDECLQHVAESLRNVARRAGEVVARYGGEELAFILPGSEVAAGAQLAELARKRVAELGIPHAKNPNGVVTISLGVAGLDPNAAQEPKDLIAAADAALYRAKTGGRNRVEIG